MKYQWVFWVCFLLWDHTEMWHLYAGYLEREVVSNIIQTWVEAIYNFNNFSSLRGIFLSRIQLGCSKVSSLIEFTTLLVNGARCDTLHIPECPSHQLNLYWLPVDLTLANDSHIFHLQRDPEHNIHVAGGESWSLFHMTQKGLYVFDFITCLQRQEKFAKLIYCLQQDRIGRASMLYCFSYAQPILTTMTCYTQQCPLIKECFGFDSLFATEKLCTKFIVSAIR